MVTYEHKENTLELFTNQLIEKTRPLFFNKFPNMIETRGERIVSLYYKFWLIWSHYFIEVGKVVSVKSAIIK